MGTAQPASAHAIEVESPPGVVPDNGTSAELANARGESAKTTNRDDRVGQLPLSPTL